MSTVSLRVHYRPLKIGFLVRTGEAYDLKRAAELNAALLGGIYNPIIPVGDVPELTDKLIWLFRCDVLYPVSDEAVLLKTFSRYSWLAWPNRREKPGLFHNSKGEKSFSVLDVRPLIWQYWEQKYRYTKGGSDFVLISWQPSEVLNTLFTLQFGRYPVEVTYDYSNAFTKGLMAEEFVIQDDPVPEELARKISPIELTGHKLMVLRDVADFDGVYVGDPNNFYDLANFWNLRASGVDIVFLPLGDEERLTKYIKAYLSDLWTHAEKRPEHMRYINVYYSHEYPKEEIKAGVRAFIPKGASILYSALTKPMWAGFDARSVGYLYEEPQTVLANVDSRENEAPQIIFALPPKPLPDTRLIECRNQLWAIEITPITEYVYQGYTLSLPVIRELNEWYGRKCILVNPFAFRVQPEAITVIENFGKETLYLTPISHRELIIRIFPLAGIEAKPSQPGKIAERLILQMGGLEGCRVFKIRGVRNLIRSREAREGVTRGRATDVIFKGEDGTASFENFRKLYIERRDKPDLDPQDVFNFLLKKCIFRAGLKLPCPNCTLEFWVPVDDLGDFCTCEFCGHSFLLGPLLHDRGDWRFRLTGLFGRGDDQEGAVPVVLTLLQLFRRRLSGRTFLYSTALELKGTAVNCEVDLAVLGVDPYESPVILLGECKSSNEITNDDTEKLLQVRDAMERARIKCCLLFSKTALEFTDAEIDRFRRLNMEKIPVILFAAQELEPYDPYENVKDKDKLPYPYASTFFEMAANSAYQYLTK